MNKKRFTISALGAVIFTVAFASLAQAQATRTWVSGVGDDANPCSRTAPCKTFAGAISKTANGGEISVLDPGGFGAVTITKSITINGEGTLAGILAAGTNGIIINAGVNDVIYLRYLTINGAGTGLNGIRFLAGKELHVQNVDIYGFTGNGIDAPVAASTAAGGTFMFLSRIYMNKITGVGSFGVKVASTNANFIKLFMDDVHISHVSTGLQVGAITNATVRNSVLAHETTGIEMVAGASGSTLILENSMLSNNNTGLAAGSATASRLSQVSIVECSTGISGTGTVQSSGNNRILGNGTDGVTPSIVNPK